MLRSPAAPQWNIAGLWVATALMALRSFSVFVEDGGAMSREELFSVALTLAGIVSVSLGWTIVWTLYFRQSMRVQSTFC